MPPNPVNDDIVFELELDSMVLLDPHIHELAWASDELGYDALDEEIQQEEDGSVLEPAMSAPPASEGPCRSNTPRRQARDEARRAKLRAKQDEQAQALQASSSLESRAQQARGYTGPHSAGRKPKEQQLVSMGVAGAVIVRDLQGRKVVYRGRMGPSALVMNEALLKARSLLQDIRPLVRPGKKGSRGPFNQFFFSCHRGSTVAPRMSAGYLKHRQLADAVLLELEPVRCIVNSIMEQQFPKQHARYLAVMDYIRSRCPSVRPLFYPFASLAINMDGVCCREHRDSENLATGLCVVIPFGSFDPSKDGRLVIKELGMEFELAPGVPIFFPSAMYTHYNTELQTRGLRASLVLWSGGSLFQWADLHGRAVNELSAEEKKIYYKNAAARLQEGLSCLG